MRLMEKITKRPPPLISFFASLEVQLAIIIIDYCAVICIIDPRQKVKRFISEIAYFKNLLCILKCLKFLWGKKRPPEGMCPQTCWCNHIDITSTSLIKTIGPIRSSFNSYSVISLFTLVSMIRGNRIGGTEKQRKCVARSRFLVISWRMSHCSDNRKCKENSLKLDTNKTFCKFTIVRGFFFLWKWQSISFPSSLMASDRGAARVQCVTTQLFLTFFDMHRSWWNVWYH